MKVVDLVAAGEFGLVLSATPLAALWWIEVIVGVVLPIILLSVPKIRQDKVKLFLSAMLVVIGVVINRFAVSWLALAGRPGYTYTPHWMEIAVSVGLVAWAIIILMIANRYLPMHYHEGKWEVGDKS